MAKQKIMERIQQDRNDKQKKYEQEREEQEKMKDMERVKQEELKQEKQMMEAAKNSEIARIKFCFTDGSSLSSQFDPNQKLEEVREFVAQKIKEMNGIQSFSMHSSFPKREYTINDMKSTLRDLQLAPTATLLIIPVRSQISKKIGNILPNSNSNTASSSSLVTYTKDILSFVFLPVTIIWGIFSSLFGLGSTQQTNDRNNRQSNNNPPSNSSSQANRSERKPGGKISGLKRDNDDENATWNGNSTQQM